MQHSLETLQREKTLGVRGDGRRQNTRINSKRVKTSDYNDVSFNPQGQRRTETSFSQ